MSLSIGACRPIWTSYKATSQGLQTNTDSSKGLEKVCFLVALGSQDYTNSVLGTFSTVYKAEDVLYDRYDNSWDFDNESVKWTPPPLRRQSSVGSNRSPRK